MSFDVLLVGLGNRGRMWARIVGGMPGVNLAGVVDIDPARIAAFPTAAPAFTFLPEAIAATRPDAVLLVTPPGGHLDQLRCVFEAGIPVLCEKPLTLDLAEAAEILRLADLHHVPLSVGLNFRYLPVSQAIRSLVADSTFGPPGFGSFLYQRNRDWWRPGLNTYPRTMRHPMMLEQTIHHLDLIRFCYGREVTHIACRSWNPAWSVYDDDANVSCLLTLEGGLEVDYIGTWTGGWNELQFQWRTDCPDGVIIQRALFGDLATARTGDAALTPVELAPCEAFYDDSRALLEAFNAALRAGTKPPCDGPDHLRTLALCFAGIEANATGRRVELADFKHRHGLAP